MFAVGADARERIQRFLGQLPVEALLDELAEIGGERCSQLMANVGDKLRRNCLRGFPERRRQEIVIAEKSSNFRYPASR